MPDGSRLQISRRSSRSRASGTRKVYKLEETSKEEDDEEEDDEEEDDESSYHDNDSPGPSPPHSPGPPSSPGDRSPSPPLRDPGDPRDTGTPGTPGLPGNPDGTGNMAGRNRGIGKRFSQVRKRLKERWVVGREQPDPRTSPIGSDLISPQPRGSGVNLTPPAPARPGGSGRAVSPGSDPRGDRPLRLRHSGEPAAPPPPPPDQVRRSRQPPDWFQAGGSTPVQGVRKAGKSSKGRKL